MRASQQEAIQASLSHICQAIGIKPESAQDLSEQWLNQAKDTLHKQRQVEQPKVTITPGTHLIKIFIPSACPQVPEAHLKHFLNKHDRAGTWKVTHEDCRPDGTMYHCRKRKPKKDKSSSKKTSKKSMEEKFAEMNPEAQKAMLKKMMEKMEE